MSKIVEGVYGLVWDMWMYERIKKIIFISVISSNSLDSNKIMNKQTKPQL